MVAVTGWLPEANEPNEASEPNDFNEPIDAHGPNPKANEAHEPDAEAN